MGIIKIRPITFFLFPAIGQVCKASFRLVSKVINMITAKVLVKQEAVQLASVLLLLG